MIGIIYSLLEYRFLSRSQLFLSNRQCLILLSSFYTLQFYKDDDQHKKKNDYAVLLKNWCMIGIYLYVSSIVDHVLFIMPFYYEAKIVILSVIVICIAIRNDLIYSISANFMMKLADKFVITYIIQLVNWVYLFFIANYITISDRTTLEKIRKNNTNLKNDIQSKEKEE